MSCTYSWIGIRPIGLNSSRNASCDKKFCRHVRPTSVGSNYRCKLKNVGEFSRPICSTVASQNIVATESCVWEALSKSLQDVGSFETSPEEALLRGQWVKLICGASFEDVAEVRNLALIYTLAGVDCIDCAADPAVYTSVVEGISAAKNIVDKVDGRTVSPFKKPWIMISINDDEDPHFRKAEFDSSQCPRDCPRPCERVCPALAIQFLQPSSHQKGSMEGGVITERCYGCGRCLPVCPVGIIGARTYVRNLEAVVELLRSKDIDAVEIHTGAGHLTAFETLVSQLGHILEPLKLVAVSVPDLGKDMVPTLSTMYTMMRPFVKGLNLWQLDGRPMSGDIGAGATKAAVSLALRVLTSPDRPPGFLQLAGGTNAHTATAMRKLGLLQTCYLTYEGQTGLSYGPEMKPNQGRQASVAGVAYGGYARKIVAKCLQKMSGSESSSPSLSHGRWTGPLLLEQHPQLLLESLQEAISLISTVKCCIM